MNIIVQNRRGIEFQLADLDCVIKDYVEDQGTVVSYFNFVNTYTFFSTTLLKLDYLLKFGS